MVRIFVLMNHLPDVFVKGERDLRCKWFLVWGNFSPKKIKLM